MAGVMLLAAACSDSTVPSLAPGTTAPPAPPTTASTTVATTTSTTATPPPSAAPSTTQSRDARFQEIQELAQEAFVGRLKAIYDKDKEALLQWVGSQKAYDGALQGMERSTFTAEPNLGNVSLVVATVLLDRPDCVVAEVVADSSAVIAEAEGTSESIVIWWPSSEGTLQLAASWGSNTPESVWSVECDLAVREVNS
jgi:hypothetical protein